MTVGTRERLESHYTELRQMLINGNSFSEMAKRFNCGIGTIYNFLEEKGDNVKRYPFSASSALHDSKYIIDLHNKGNNARQIGEILNYDTQVISALLKKMGRRSIRGVHKNGFKYDINHDLFDNIDNEAKAYYLGWLASDGCVVENAITIQLKNTDSYILEPFRDLVCPEKVLHEYKTKCNSEQVRLVWRSTKTVESLSKLGITPRKSLTMGKIASQLDKELIHHFIRGYFDGDGWITKHCYRNKKFVTIGMIGTRDFLEDVHDCIGLPVGKIYNVKHIPNLARLTYWGKGRMYELKDYLYKDATLFLTRKKEKFVW